MLSSPQSDALTILSGIEGGMRREDLWDRGVTGMTLNALLRRGLITVDYVLREGTRYELFSVTRRGRRAIV